MGEGSSLYIPEPVSLSSPSVSADELEVCWDCGGGGGMGGLGRVFSHRRRVIWLRSDWVKGMTGQAKQTERRCEVIPGAGQR